MFAETYLNLLGDPNHWGFELTVEAVTGLVGFVVGAFWVRRHDRKHHEEPLTVDAIRAIVREEIAGDVPAPVLTEAGHRLIQKRPGWPPQVETK